MPKKVAVIPVHSLPKEHQTDCVVTHVKLDNLKTLHETEHSHRHDYHIFLLLRKGIVDTEVDFEQYRIKAPAVLYIHPSQVHRIVNIKNVDMYLLGMNSENLNPEYLTLLEQEILPAKVFPLKPTAFAILDQTLTLCSTISERKTGKHHPSVVKDYCNAFVGEFVSLYLEQSISTSKLSRAHILTKKFNLLLERDFASIKRPTDYAKTLSISTQYLNECIKSTTGFSVSYHIQQRIILEAKRLLFHSNKSVKEIASELGYDDAAYFSRLFSTVTGMTALAFRQKNRD